MLGDILYLYIHDINSLLAVNQELNPARFVRVIEEMPVIGGKKDEQYMRYKAQCIFDDSKIYTINNYLSPFKYINLKELNKAIDDTKYLLTEERISAMNSILEKVNEKTR